jgi:UDP-N-acetylmuramate--alanine ligase
MSGLAEILLNLGYDVSGSDLAESDIIRRLQSFGLRARLGHSPDHIGGAEILVYSEAVPEDNVELVAARRRGTPTLHRADLLADLMRLKPNAVAVGGTHGKTTTTSMISAILDRANFGATSIVGGILHRSGTNARWGTGDYIVAEADEHDGSFLRLHPTVAVVTNIDAEHLEYYGTVDRIKRAFTEFCNDVPFYGYSILCGDDANCREILNDVDSIALTYGLEDGVSLEGRNPALNSSSGGDPLSARLGSIRTTMEVVSHDERFGATGVLGEVDFHGLGLHNARNALAACAVGLCLGLRFGHIADGLRMYDGVRRRLQVCGEQRGVAVLEDYGHHPTEIAQTLDAVRQVAPKRIICVFQPHLYSRTKFFYEDFARVLASADRALVTAIYPSREEPMPGVDAGLIVEAAVRGGAGAVELVNDKDAVAGVLAAECEEGDCVLLLGAGDINRIAGPVLEALARPA